MNYSAAIRFAGDWAPGSKSVAEVSFSNHLILNLEGPVLQVSKGFAEHKRPKSGPHLFNRQLPNNKHKGIAVLSNNHIMDYGSYGLKETIITLDRVGWSHLGAGLKSKAEEPLIFDWDGKRTAILARCETQFGGASETREGVATFGVSIYKQIREIKKSVDFIIVSVHAAAEMVPWPSPRRQEAWRSLIDAGANVVHGHHSHLPQGWEKYNDGLIFYGLGNFCVDPAKWRWHPHSLWSVTPELYHDHQGIHMTLKTVVIDDTDDGVLIRDANPDETKNHVTYLNLCNHPLADQMLLEGVWQEASIALYKRYFSQWLGFERPLIKRYSNAIRQKLKTISRTILSRQLTRNPEKPELNKQLLWYHLFACDSHNDAISTALGVLSGELEDRRTSESRRLIKNLVILD